MNTDLEVVGTHLSQTFDSDPGIKFSAATPSQIAKRQPPHVGIVRY